MISRSEVPQPLVLEHLKTELNRGLVWQMQSRYECIGFHGLSHQALMFVLNTGYFHGETLDNGPFALKNSLYYYPLIDQSQSYFLALEAARAGSFYDALIQSLSRFSNSPYLRAVIEGIDDADNLDRYALEWFNRQHIPEYQRQEIIMAAESRQGYVLGIHPSVLSSYPVTDCSLFGEEGFRIEPGDHHLPFSIIHGIFPLGPMETDFLTNL